MNPVKQKMVSFLTEVARKQIEALEPESACVKELNKIEVDDVTRAEIEKIYAAATLAELTKIALLASRMSKGSEHKKEAIKSDLKRIGEEILNRVEVESGPLKLSENCRDLLFNL